MDNKLITGIIGVVVVVALLGSALVPVIDGLTEGEKITNEGAGWLRMEYNTGSSYEVAADAISSDDGLLVYNGTDTQIGTDDTIIYASSNLTAWMQDGGLKVLGTSTDGVVYAEPEESFIITRDSDGVSLVIDDGEIPYTFNTPSWAYIPISTGNYGFFNKGTAVQIEDGKPIAAAGGGVVGVYAANDMTRYAGLGLQMETEFDENGKLIGAHWVKPASADDQRSGRDDRIIDIIPFDPDDSTRVDEDPVMLRSVPTPTYTDGDWGYDLTTVGDVTKAVIVSYSGAGGGVITVPATVGGYNVYQVGKGDSNNSPIMSSVSATGLVISEGIEVIGTSAFYYCSGISGPLTLPSTLTIIGDSSFNACSGLSGTLTIPDTVTSIGNAAFKGCNHFTGDIVIPDSVTTLGPNAFANDTRFDGTLTLSKNITVISDDAFYNCNSLTGGIVLPNGLTTIGARSFYGCRHVTGPVVIPDTVTSIGTSAFNHDYTGAIETLIIASNATPANATIFKTTADAVVLDLSDIDYSTNRYGISATATITDSIGDAIGYISFIEIGSDAPLSGGAAALLIAVPVVVIAGLLVAFVGYSIVKRY